MFECSEGRMFGCPYIRTSVHPYTRTPVHPYTRTSAHPTPHVHQRGRLGARRANNPSPTLTISPFSSTAAITV